MAYLHTREPPILHLVGWHWLRGQLVGSPGQGGGSGAETFLGRPRLVDLVQIVPPKP